MRKIASTEEEIRVKRQEIADYAISLVGEGNAIIGDDSMATETGILDIYVPSCGRAIQLNGLYLHNELSKGKKDKVDGLVKCQEKGISVFHVFEDEWRDKPEIVKSMIANMLHKNINKVFARKCDIREVPTREARMFIDGSHIQGYCNSSYRYGLYHDGELVSMMTFGKHRFRKRQTDHSVYELLRFCNKLNTSVVGGASKLLSHFIKENKPSRIISYADRRYSSGNLYEKLGFKRYNISDPSYFYVIDGERKYRFTYRKDVLISKYGCTEDMTEHEFCLSQKWYRIYDCGCLCYKWEREENQ